MRQQIRPARQRAAKLLLAPPTRYLAVMPGP